MYSVLKSKQNNAISIDILSHCAQTISSMFFEKKGLFGTLRSDAPSKVFFSFLFFTFVWLYRVAANAMVTIIVRWFHPFICRDWSNWSNFCWHTPAEATSSMICSEPEKSDIMTCCMQLGSSHFHFLTLPAHMHLGRKMSLCFHFPLVLPLPSINSTTMAILMLCRNCLLLVLYLFLKRKPY